MKKLLLGLVTCLTVMIGGTALAEDTNVVEVSEFYITTSIHENNEVTTLMNLTDTIAHMQYILDINKITSKRSHIAKPFYSAIKNINLGRDDYAYADLALCKKRMIEQKIWREPRIKRVTIEGTN